MRTARLAIILVIYCAFGAFAVSAQFVKLERPLSEKAAEADTAAIADSAKIADMKSRLDEALINEANLRLEIEHMKMRDYLDDSIKLARQKARIDSLRLTFAGSPVVVGDDTIFTFYAKRGGQLPEVRAQNTASAITQVGKMLTLSPDSVYIETSENVTDIMYHNDVLLSLTDNDAMWAGCPRDSLAQGARAAIVEKLRGMKEEYGLFQLIKRIILLVTVIAGLWIVLRLINYLFRRLNTRIEKLRETKLKSINIQDYELLDTRKQVQILLFLSRMFRYLMIISALVLAVPIVFSIFPTTKHIALKIFAYIYEPVTGIFSNIIDYIPNLFTICVIYLVIKYLVRFVKYISNELETEHLKIKGFYPDWAKPTYYIIRFLLYAFMIAMIYPYLPGANSGIFQGMSVFIGLVVSLGSSSIIGNIIAGLVITYMRPFRLGDHIKLNDTTGNVIEKTPLVTRLRTPKNEIVTIPNSEIMSKETVNYSESAREFGLIIHTEVTIGYDAPWRQVHALLIDAALNTPKVVDDPRPFVLETSLSDWYPVYQLNAYVRKAEKIGEIYSNLHQNIQDAFNAAGIEIMSPHYMATRDGNASTIPPDPRHNA